MVVAQAKSAAEAGVAVLDAGGNAVDAAVATALALAAVEPWNSGLGGIGFALVHRAGQRRADVVDFGPVAPRGLDPSVFKLTGKVVQDLFAWPQVEGDTNIHGPLSVAIPSASAGYARMLAEWGRLPLREVMAPAIALAERGLPQDWYTTLKVANSACRAAPLSGERAHLSAQRPAADAALSGQPRFLPPGQPAADAAASVAGRAAGFLRGRDRRLDRRRHRRDGRRAVGR